MKLMTTEQFCTVAGTATLNHAKYTTLTRDTRTSRQRRKQRDGSVVEGFRRRGRSGITMSWTGSSERSAAACQRRTALSHTRGRGL